MKFFPKNLIVILISLLCIESAYAKSLNIAFLNGRTNQVFWGSVEDFMVEVAKDFDDVTLTIYRAESDYIKQRELLEEITSPNYKTKYDAVMTRTLKKNGLDLLDIAEKNKVPLFLFNSGLTQKQISEIEGPRIKYQYFIGEMYPDDVAAGYDSAKELLNAVKKSYVKGKRDNCV